MNATTNNWLADEALGIETREFGDFLHVRTIARHGIVPLNTAIEAAAALAPVEVKS